MPKLVYTVLSSPPDAWKWQVLAGLKVLKSGSAKSEEEAKAAAKGAIADLESNSK